MDQKSDKATATNKLLSKSQLCDKTAHNKSWFDEVEESEEIVNIMEVSSNAFFSKREYPGIHSMPLNACPPHVNPFGARFDTIMDSIYT